MVDRPTFDRIQERHGRYASWAVWAGPTDSSKVNVDDTTVLNPDRNPTLLRTLRKDIVMLGLNVSQELAEQPPFHNFHHGGVFQDYKIRYAFAGTAFWGAYMTDFIKDVPMLESEDLMRFLQKNTHVVAESVQKLSEEFSDLQCERPTILAFGKRTHRLVAEHYPATKYARLIEITHYSHYISPHEYRQVVLRQVGIASGSYDSFGSHSTVPSMQGLSAPAEIGERLTPHSKAADTITDQRNDVRSLALDARIEHRGRYQGRSHRLVRDYLALGSHDIMVPTVNQGTKGDPNDRRAYQAVCKTCGWKSGVGTGTQADKALIEHRDQTVSAAMANARSKRY